MIMRVAICRVGVDTGDGRALGRCADIVLPELVPVLDGGSIVGALSNIFMDDEAIFGDLGFFDGYQPREGSRLGASFDGPAEWDTSSPDMMVLVKARLVGADLSLTGTGEDVS